MATLPCNRFAKITRMGHEQIRFLLEDTFPSPQGSRTGPKQDGPHLRIHCLSVFVRNIEQSLQFYVGQLGFRALSDSTPRSTFLLEKAGLWFFSVTTSRPSFANGSAEVFGFLTRPKLKRGAESLRASKILMETAFR